MKTTILLLIGCLGVLGGCGGEEAALEPAVIVETFYIEKANDGAVAKVRHHTVVEFTNGERRCRLGDWGEQGDILMARRGHTDGTYNELHRGWR